MTNIILGIIAIITFAALDFVWIGTIAASLYMKSIGSLARLSPTGGFAPEIWPAVIVYVLLAVGLIIFVLPKTVGAPIGLSTFLWGALMGLVIYGVYDLTNYSFLAAWPITVTIADILWGSFLSGVTTVVLTVAVKWLG